MKPYAICWCNNQIHVFEDHYTDDDRIEQLFVKNYSGNDWLFDPTAQALNIAQATVSNGEWVGYNWLYPYEIEYQNIPKEFKTHLLLMGYSV